MTFQVLGENEQPLDAHLDLSSGDIVFHSRGGTRGAPNSRNSDYGPGLRLVLERLQVAGVKIASAWVDSGAVAHLSPDERSIIDAADAYKPPAEQFRILSTRMKEVGRSATGPGGNSTKRIRLRLVDAPSDGELVQALKLSPVRTDFRSSERLPVELLSRISAEHIWCAVERLLAGQTHAFGESTDFDLLVDDYRLPPKAVFGLAASDALGFPVLPKHFTGGLGTPAFRALAAAGYQIVAKGAAPDSQQVPPAAEDRDWSEGNPRLVTHLRKERAAGLSRAKKAAFVRENGRLFCERCGLEPTTVFPEEGDACIEVHHRATHVEKMEADHRTRLEDLECLCANCHRVVHALLRREAAA